MNLISDNVVRSLIDMGTDAITTGYYDLRPCRRIFMRGASL